MERIDESRMVKQVFEREIIDVRRVGRHHKIDWYCEKNSGILGCDCRASKGDCIWQECMKGFCKGVSLGTLYPGMNSDINGKSWHAAHLCYDV